METVFGRTRLITRITIRDFFENGLRNRIRRLITLDFRTRSFALYLASCFLLFKLNVRRQKKNMIV